MFGQSLRTLAISCSVLLRRFPRLLRSMKEISGHDYAAAVQTLKAFSNM
tara:strand:+ start:346 stop:492 length:147 start_codon:yes stop_codon:yes gene_type:complete